MRNEGSGWKVLKGFLEDVSAVSRQSRMPATPDPETQLVDSAYNYLLVTASSAVRVLQGAGAAVRVIALAALTLSLLQIIFWPIAVLLLAPFYAGLLLSLLAWSSSTRKSLTHKSGLLGWIGRHYDRQEDRPSLNISGILEIGVAPLTGLVLVAWLGKSYADGAPYPVVLALTAWIWTVAIQPTIDTGYYNLHPDRRAGPLWTPVRWIAPAGFSVLLLLSLSFQPVGYAPLGFDWLLAAFMLTPYLTTWVYHVVLSCGVFAYLDLARSYGEYRHNMAIARVHDIKKDIRTRIAVATHPETRKVLEELFPMVHRLAYPTERMKALTVKEIFDRCHGTGRWQSWQGNVSFLGPQLQETVAAAYVEHVAKLIDDLVDNALRSANDPGLTVIVEAAFSDAKRTTHQLTIRVSDTGEGAGSIEILPKTSLADQKAFCKSSQGDLIHMINPAGKGTCAVATMRMPFA
ncbi:ATP-binding protein [Pseudarthrobacter sp. RMG13]|uniref:ATP-binding protein n=1 Tax=Pseudarthrobacter humi TaxID=2952523 RepID=A0ABT1LPD5_9MICC|nr:ATP-binding protein [Pseudarthrobacter humi]MCP9000325.1 ATP-binding protein [Pseudarthrobacter humi]